MFRKPQQGFTSRCRGQGRGVYYCSRLPPFLMFYHLGKSCAMFYPHCGSEGPSFAPLGMDQGFRVGWDMKQTLSQDHGLSGAESSSSFLLTSSSFLEQDSPTSSSQSPPSTGQEPGITHPVFSIHQTPSAGLMRWTAQARSPISSFPYALDAPCRSCEVERNKWMN